MSNTTHIPSIFVEGEVIRSAHRRITTIKEIIAQRKYTLERLEKKLNLSFKLKDIIDSIPVANLQIGDTIQFLYDDPVQYERTKQIYCFAMVNSHKCLVSWYDFVWYRSYNLNETPTCDALERLLPETGCVDFDFMYNHTFKVSAYCDVDRYVFNCDGTPKYVYEVIDGKETLVRARTRFQKPMYEILWLNVLSTKECPCGAPLLRLNGFGLVRALSATVMKLVLRNGDKISISL